MINGFTIAHLKVALCNSYLGNYAPLHILSYMLDHELWGLDPGGYHLENVLFHALNGVLFYYVLRRIDISEQKAAFAAWIFLFHPVQVETVAWVSQRKNLLAMFFFLLALLAYQQYCRRDDSKLLNYMLTLVCAIAAMLSKSVAVIFPIIVLWYDYTILENDQRSFSKRMCDNFPFVVVAVVIALATILSQSAESGGGRRDIFHGSILASFYTMAPILVDYLKDCLYPTNLIAFYYMIDISQTPDIKFLAAVIILALIAALGVMLYHKRRPLLFWLGLFFIALVPVMQIVPIITLKNDRYLYFPMLGFAVLAVEAAYFLRFLMPASCKCVLKVCCVSILLALPLCAYRQTMYWRNDITLWSHAVEVEPANRLGWQLLSMGYTMQGDAANAARSFSHYMELYNRQGTIHYYEEQ